MACTRRAPERHHRDAKVWEIVVLEVASGREVTRSQLRGVEGFTWAFSSDGNTLALAATHTGNPTNLRPEAGTTVELSSHIFQYHTISLFDVATGQPRAQWSAAGGVAFTRDGRHLFGGGRVWSLDTRNPALLFPVGVAMRGDHDLALPVAFSADGRSLITFPDATEMARVDVRTGKVLERRRALFAGQSLSENVDLSPDGGTVHFGRSWEPHLYNTVTGTDRLLATRDEFNKGIRRRPGLFSPDGKRVLIVEEHTSDNKRRTEIWDTATLRRVQVLPDEDDGFGNTGLSESTSHLAWSPDGSTIACLNPHGGTLYLWDVATGTRRRAPMSLDGLLSDFLGVPTDFKFTPDGRTLLLLSRAGTLGGHAWDKVGDTWLTGYPRITQINVLSSWDVATMRFRTATPCVPAGEAMTCLPDGRTVALLGQRGVHFWDLHESREVARLPLPAPYPRASALGSASDGVRPLTRGHLAVSPDGSKVAAVFARLPFGVGWRKEIAPDGQEKHVWTDHARVAVWDVPPFTNTTAIVTSLAVSPDGKWIAAGRSDHAIHLFEPKDWKPGTAGKPVRVLQGHKQIVRGLAFSPDGRHLASVAGAGNQPGEVKLWDFAEGKELVSLPGHKDEVTAVAFRPDGLELATGGVNGQVLLWNLGGWKKSGTLPPPKRWPEKEPDPEEDPEALTIDVARRHVAHLAYRTIDKAVVLVVNVAFVGGWDRRLTNATHGVWLGTRWGMPFVQDVFLHGEWKTQDPEDHRGHRRESLGHPAGTWHNLGEELERNHTLVRLSADERFVAWGTDRGTVIVYAIADSPDGGKWNVRTKLPEIAAHKGPVRAVAFTPDGKRLVSGGEDGTVKLWALPSR